MTYIIRYYYFRLYSYFADGDRVPFFSTFLVLTAFGYFNLITIINSILSLWLNIRFTMPVFKGWNILWLILAIACCWLVLQHYFKRLGHHDKIIDEFKNENSKQKAISKLLVLLYLLITIASFFTVLWLRQRLRGF